MKASEVKRSPWSIRPRTLVKPILLLALLGGLALGLLIAASALSARLHEPPIADPHDGWCGRGELNALLDPIRPHRDSNSSSTVNWMSLAICRRSLGEISRPLWIIAQLRKNAGFSHFSVIF